MHYVIKSARMPSCIHNSNHSIKTNSRQRSKPNLELAINVSYFFCLWINDVQHHPTIKSQALLINSTFFWNRNHFDLLYLPKTWSKSELLLLQSSNNSPWVCSSTGFKHQIVQQTGVCASEISPLPLLDSLTLSHRHLESTHFGQQLIMHLQSQGNKPWPMNALLIEVDHGRSQEYLVQMSKVVAAWADNSWQDTQPDSAATSPSRHAAIVCWKRDSPLPRPLRGQTEEFRKSSTSLQFHWNILKPMASLNFSYRG